MYRKLMNYTIGSDTDKSHWLHYIQCSGICLLFLTSQIFPKIILQDLNLTTNIFICLIGFNIYFEDNLKIKLDKNCNGKMYMRTKIE